jgi:hypothetical protein
MRKKRIDHVSNAIQDRKRSLEMWNKIYKGFQEGKETQETLLLAMTSLNSLDHSICHSPNLSMEDKDKIWSDAR